MRKSNKMNKVFKQINDMYNSLCKLAENPENTFTKIDVTSSMQTKFVIFSYHIASYSDWLYPYSLESRGIMFEMDENNNPIRIACRPMQKFFNLYENPFTEELLDNEIQYVFAKEDGSLISTFLDKGELFVKTKASLFSQQALDAQKWLYDPKRKPLFNAIKEYTELGYTVNMEWVSPDNRIVLSYEEPRLIVLNIRNNITGEYIPREELLKDGQISQYLVDAYAIGNLQNILDEVKDMKNEEGFVIWKNDKPYCKIKCPWYIHLHSVKSSIASDKNLWESVAEGVTDDIKVLFEADPLAVKRISDFELMYKKSFSSIYNTVISVYNQLQGLSRKDYAIKSQSILNNENPKLFGIVMRLYLTGPDDELLNSIKDHLVKFREDYIDINIED